jgi:hypothetical protein
MSKLAVGEVCLEGIDARFATKGFWAALSKSVGKLHCRLVHKAISHPVNGKYRCWTCLQEFDTNW